MLKEPEILEFDKLTVEVNWNKEVTPCEKIKFKIGKEEAVIDRSELYQMLFFFGDEDQQEELIPVTEEKVRSINMLIKVRAKKDIKKGEMVQVRYQYMMPISQIQKLRLSEDKNVVIN